MGTDEGVGGEVPGSLRTLTERLVSGKTLVE